MAFSVYEVIGVACQSRIVGLFSQLRERLRLQQLAFMFGGVESYVITTKGYLVFQQENPDNSKLAEKAAELTIGALLDVTPIFNGQTFDAIT